jgi:hypothetical protein
MSRNSLRNSIEQQATTNLRIGAELTDIVEFLITNGYVPNGPAIKTPDFTNQCSAASYYRIERLHELGMVQKYKKGPKTYLIHTRKDEIVNGQSVSKMVNEELHRVAQHAQQNPAVLTVVANARGTPQGQALQGLTNGGFAIRRNRLDDIVNAIQTAPNVSQGPYGKIIFRTPPNLYRASPIAVQLY